jgi:hypothetical protein
MLGTQERNSVRTDERRYSAYTTAPKEYFEEDYYNTAEYAREAGYQELLWNKLNTAGSQANRQTTYREANNYYAPPSSNIGYCRPTSRQMQNTPVFTLNEQKTRGGQKNANKISTKGKIILAVYIAVVVAISTLVIINAGGLNTGSAASTASGGNVSMSATQTSEGLYIMSSPSSAAEIETNSFDKFLDGIVK